jgi:hypothetical protein
VARYGIPNITVIDFANLVITKTLLWWEGDCIILCEADSENLLGVRADNEFWYVKLTDQEHDEIAENWPDISIVDYYQHSREIYVVSQEGVIVKPPWIWKEFWLD